MREQIDKLAYAHTSFFTTQVAEELADDLVAHAPHGIGHVFFVSGGSEAIEGALQTARQYFFANGEPQRRYLLARPPNYHRTPPPGPAVGGRGGARPRVAPPLVVKHHRAP